MTWIAVDCHKPHPNNGYLLYIIRTRSVFGKGIGVANYIDDKFMNIKLSGDSKAPSDVEVTHWMPMPDMPDTP